MKFGAGQSSRNSTTPNRGHIVMKEAAQRKPFSSGVASRRRADRRSCLWTILLRLRLGDLIRLWLGNVMRAL
jgi:hypothetical protein